MVCNYISWNRNFWRMELIEQMKAGRGKGGKQLITYGEGKYDMLEIFVMTYSFGEVPLLMFFYEMCPHILHIISKRDWFCLDSSNCVHF